MPNFMSLNLPVDPVLDLDSLLEIKHEGAYFIRDPASIIKPAILDSFNKVGLVPWMAILFERGDSHSTPGDRIIHRDITRKGNPPWDNTNVSDPVLWNPIVCGVNWELTGSTCEFSWFDMTEISEVWPDVVPHNTNRLNYLNGVHYDARWGQGIPDTARLLETYKFSGPTLVRTDIPHMTTYTSPAGTQKRIALSLRFHETWQTWEQAIQCFAKLKPQPAFRYFRELDIPIGPAIEQLQAYVRSHRHNIRAFWNNVSTEQILSQVPELPRLFEPLGLTIKRVAFVLSHPGDGEIHVDDDATAPSARINLPVMNCENSATKFYQSHVKPEHKKLGNGVSYKYFHPAHCELKETLVLSKATVIRPLEPHQVCVYGNQPRISCTISFDQNIEHLL